MPRILSVHTGRIETRLDARGREDTTAIGKQPVDGPVRIGPKGLEGDESNYRSRETGDTAVHIFSRETYAHLSTLAGRPLAPPCFGENLLVEGYPDAEVRVGDVVRAGTALLRVNQPCIRCSWPGVQGGEKRLGKWAMQAGMPGFYLDVLEPGLVAAGDALEVVSRGPEGWTISRLTALLLNKTPDPAERAAALALPELAERWKEELREEELA